MTYCFGCNTEAEHTANCPTCGHGYLTCEGCAFCGYNMKVPNAVTLRVNRMAQNMRLFEFPCGETSCEEISSMELEIRTTDAEYKMPLCAKHAKRLAEDARISRL